jgi:hypothetical protein
MDATIAERPRPDHRKGCRAIRSQQTQRWRQRSAAGEVFWVDAEPVRAHVRRLMEAYGVPVDVIAAQADVSYGSVRNLLYGNGASPSHRLTAVNGQRLLSAHFDLDLLRPNTLTNAIGTQRRVQGLVVAGYCIAEQARRLGRDRNFYRIISADAVRADLARAVRDLADALEATPPPTSTRAQRSALSKARTMAARHPEWVVLAAWDDIDNPDATPCTDVPPDTLPDEEEVARILAGVDSIKGLREADIYRAITLLMRRGKGITAISERLHCNGQMAQRLLSRAERYEQLLTLDSQDMLSLHLLQAANTVHIGACQHQNAVLCSHRGVTQTVESCPTRRLCQPCLRALGPFRPRVLERCHG